MSGQDVAVPGGVLFQFIYLFSTRIKCFVTLFMF